MFRSLVYSLPFTGMALAAALSLSAAPTAASTRPAQFNVADDQSSSWFSPLHIHHWLNVTTARIG